MSDARDVLNRTLEKVITNTSPDIKICEPKLDTQKLLKELSYCDVSTVQVGGQRYTYVSLESLMGAIENSQLEGVVENDQSN